MPRRWYHVTCLGNQYLLHRLPWLAVPKERPPLPGTIQCFAYRCRQPSSGAEPLRAFQSGANQETQGKETGRASYYYSCPWSRVGPRQQTACTVNRNMDHETAEYLWALQEVNKALIIGLERSVFWMDKWVDLTLERRKSIKEKLVTLLTESKKAHGTEFTIQ